MDILGIISGKKLGRERFDRDVQRERDNAVFAASINPDTPMTQAAREAVWADYGKRYTDPKDPQSLYHYNAITSAARSAVKHKQMQALPSPTANANPASVSRDSMPTSSGGMTTPATSGFSAAMLRPAPPPQDNILFSSPFQKKTINSGQQPIEAAPTEIPPSPAIAAAAPAVRIQRLISPEADNPPPTSPISSPGMNSIAPANTPTSTGFPKPFRWTQTDQEYGANKAARELPTKEGEYKALHREQNAAMLQRQKDIAAYNQSIIKDRVEELKQDGTWDKLTARQQAAVKAGQNPSAERATPVNRFRAATIEVDGEKVPSLYESSTGTYYDLAHNPIDTDSISAIALQPQGTSFDKTVEAYEKQLGRKLSGPELQAIRMSAGTTTSDAFLPTPEGGFVRETRVSQRTPLTPALAPPSPAPAPGAVTMPLPSPTSPATPRSRSVSGAGRPIDPATQREIGGLTFSLRQAGTIKDLLEDPKFADATAAFGPLSGKVKLAEVNKLGGMGATENQVAMAVKLQRFLSSQAFADGGKQLTPTEFEQFKAVSPKMDDTLAAALTKAREAYNFLQDRRQSRLDTLPEVQKQAMMKSLGLSGKGITAPGVPPPAQAASTLPPEVLARLKEGIVTKFANGQSWMLKGGKPVQVTQ